MGSATSDSSASTRRKQAIEPDARWNARRVKLPNSDQLQDMKLKTGESFRVAPLTVHCIQAITDCDILEASTPHLDDVVRLEDRYGREGTSAP